MAVTEAYQPPPERLEKEKDSDEEEEEEDEADVGTANKLLQQETIVSEGQRSVESRPPEVQSVVRAERKE